MYGYSVSRNGILTDNYYKQIGEYTEPEPQGVYVMIRKVNSEVLYSWKIGKQGNKAKEGVLKF